MSLKVLILIVIVCLGFSFKHSIRHHKRHSKKQAPIEPKVEVTPTGINVQETVTNPQQSSFEKPVPSANENTPIKIASKSPEEVMQSASEMIKLANKVAHETESKEKAKEQSLVSGNFANNEVKVNPESQPVTEENKKAEEKIAHVESKYTLENTPTSPDPNEAEKYGNITKIKKISPYASVQIKYLNDPLLKEQSAYISGETIYDEAPNLYKDVMSLASSSIAVPHYEHSQEKKDLWSKFPANNFHNVHYGAKGAEDGDTFQTVIKGKEVNVVKIDKTHDSQSEIDSLISKAGNPVVKGKLYESKHDSTFAPTDNVAQGTAQRLKRRRKFKADDIISDDDLTERRRRRRRRR